MLVPTWRRYLIRIYAEFGFTPSPQPSPIKGEGEEAASLRKNLFTTSPLNGKMVAPTRLKSLSHCRCTRGILTNEAYNHRVWDTLKSHRDFQYGKANR